MNHCTNSCLTPLIQHSIFMPHSSSLPFQPHWSFISWKTTSSWPPRGLCNGHLRLAVTSLLLQTAAASSLWCVLHATSSEIFLVTWSTHPQQTPKYSKAYHPFPCSSYRKYYFVSSDPLYLQQNASSKGKGNLIWIVLCLAYSGCSTNTVSVNKANGCQALCYEWVLEIRGSACSQTVQILVGK